jgi:hypothetical protein
MTDQTDKMRTKRGQIRGGIFMSGFSGATGVPLKQMQDAIAQSTAYASGDTETFNNVYFGVGGFLTSASTQMEFFVPIPKSPSSGAVTCTRFTGLIRGINGYVDNVSDASTDWLSMSGMSLTVQKSARNMIRIVLKRSTAYANTANNTPIYGFVQVTLSFA